jgi:hypothetical protein
MNLMKEMPVRSSLNMYPRIGGKYRNRVIVHCTENPINVFPEMKLCGLVPNSYIHVPVSGLYIPRIRLPIFGCSKIGRQIIGIKSLRDT